MASYAREIAAYRRGAAPVDRLAFAVRSSSGPGVYQLEARRTSQGVRFTCSCPAGEVGQQCKHRMALLLGDVSAVVEVSASAVRALSDMVRASPIIAALDELAEAERRAEEAKQRIATAKKSLSRVMKG